MPVRLRLDAKALPRDYRLTPGTSLALGGTPSVISGSQDIFPLAGLASPVALIKAERGGLSLVPVPPAGEMSPTLSHNGLRLQQPAPLRPGDDLRVVRAGDRDGCRSANTGLKCWTHTRRCFSRARFKTTEPLQPFFPFCVHNQ